MEKKQNEKRYIANIEISEEEEPPSKFPPHLPDSDPIARLMCVRQEEQPAFSPRSLEFLKTFFPGATLRDWNNWHWQVKNSARSIAELGRYINLSDNEIGILSKDAHSLPLRITPYYISLLDRDDAEQPLRKSVVPVFDEYIVSQGEASDPLSEEHDSPVPNIVHRYPDRVLFLATGFCSTYCRYCTRTHMVAKDKCHIGIKAWEDGLQYIADHPEVRDVLVSGGDPLTMPDYHIEYLLRRLRSIGHVEIIRIGTKVPAVLPQRITRPLVSMLKKYHPLFISIHFTHPSELTEETREACERLANAGIPLGSQTVLLKGINDDTAVMKQLMHGLLKVRVRPYYLYQCDPILGSGHFRTTIDKGLEIIRGLRGHTTGYAVPQFVVDAPGGGGKIPLLPDYYQGHDGQNAILKNYEGKTFRYPDPTH